MLPKSREFTGQLKSTPRPRPPGTLVSFIHSENDSNAFSTIVGDEGKYNYHPPANVSIPPGEFIVLIRPLYSKTVEDENGMQQEEMIPGMPKSFGKYSDAKKSDLRVTLEPGKVEKFDISIRTNKK